LPTPFKLAGNARPAQHGAEIGGYPTNKWTELPHGEDYRNAITGADRPDVERVADALFSTLGPQIADVEDDSARK
jgi:hypothetical protein